MDFTFGSFTTSRSLKIDLNIQTLKLWKLYLCICYMGTWLQVFGLWPCARLLWLDWHGHKVGTDYLAGTGSCRGMLGNKDITECELPPRRRGQGRERKHKRERPGGGMSAIPHPYAGRSKFHPWCLCHSETFFIISFIFIHYCWYFFSTAFMGQIPAFACWSHDLLWLISQGKMSFLFLSAKNRKRARTACTALSYKNREESRREMGLTVK